jgi:hypothetical protein
MPHGQGKKRSDRREFLFGLIGALVGVLGLFIGALTFVGVAKSKMMLIKPSKGPRR